MDKIKIIRDNGVAGQFALTADYVSHGERRKLSFVGSSFGSPGPVTMITPSGLQIHVTDAARFGDKFNPQWVRNFINHREG